MAKSPYNWQLARTTWLEWVQRGKTDPPTLAQLAALLDIPFHTLAKRTGQWRREQLAELAETPDPREQPLTTDAPSSSNGKDPEALTGNQSQERSSAASLSPGGQPSPRVDEVNTGNLQAASNSIRSDVQEYVEALKQESKFGTGPARIAASKELLGMAGIVKATESKAERSPYADMTGKEIRKRVLYLLQRVRGGGAATA